MQAGMTTEVWQEFHQNLKPSQDEGLRGQGIYH